MVARPFLFKLRLKLGVLSMDRWLFFILLCYFSSPSFAALATGPDFVLEQQWQEQLEDYIVVGEPLWLQDHQARPFMTIYAESEGTSKGTVVLLHNMGGHPNWHAVIGPLRRELLDKGWSTLSLQMPVLGGECGGREHAVLLDDSPGRLDAALAFLEQQGEQNVVLLGHGLGAIMAGAYLVDRPLHKVRGLAALGWYMLRNSDPRMYAANYLGKLQLPILDIFGSGDVLVANARDARQLAVNLGGNDDYKQVEIRGADMFFEGHEKALLKKVSRWLSRLPDQ